MNLMEMIAALFAVVFFTSIASVYNNNAFRQKQNLYHANAFLQASVLAHEVLDEVDAKLFSKSLSFDDIETEYNLNRTRVLSYVGETFQLAITATAVDSVGVPLSTPNPGNNFTKVSVTVAENAALKHSVTMSRIYTKTHLYH